MKILICDDHKIVRDGLRQILNQLEDISLIGEAASGSEALEILKDISFHILLLDITMPGMSGLEVLKSLSEINQETIVIMMTGYVTQESVLSCMRHGADTCIFKPWPDLVEIETAVTTAEANIRTWKQKLRQLYEMKPTERKPDA